MKVSEILLESFFIISSIIVLAVLVFDNYASAILLIRENTSYLLQFLIILFLSALYTCFAILKGKRLIIRKMIEV